MENPFPGGGTSGASTFTISQITLTYTAGANGTITGTSPQTVNYNGSGTAVTAVPHTGYHFVNWSDASIDNPRTDTNVTANISVTANFAINTYTLTYTAGANGTISGTTPQTVNHGANGTAVTAVPNTGYRFVNWSDLLTANPRTDLNVTGNISATANFALNLGGNITVNPTSGLITTEGGGMSSFTVVLDSAPTASVTFTVASSDTGEATVFVPSVTFTTSNWSTPRTIYVRGVDDDLVDGDQPLTIVLGTASSSDPNYNGINVPDVSVTNRDDPFERPPLGGETRVNATTAGTQTLAANGRSVALDADGNFVVVWESTGQDGDQGGIYGRRFDYSGAALGGEFRVNTTTTGNQTYPSVAKDAAGNFLVVWSGNGPGDTDGVFGQRYAANGNALGGEFRVNAAASGVQSRPVVGARPTGGYVVAWSESDVLHMVQVDATGALVNPTTLAAAGTIDGPIDVAVAADGSYVVVWEEQATVQVACFEANGTLRYQISVNAGMNFYDFDPSVAISANGEFGVAWAPYDYYVDNITYVYFQRFRLSDGELDGTPLAVAADVGGSPSLAMDANGNAFVTYLSGSSIIKATLNATNAFVGAQRIVNTTATGTRNLPSIVSDANGNQITVWSGEGTGDATGVFVQRYGTFPAPTNDPPVADDDAYATDENTPLVEPADGVLLNDADPDGDPITAVLVSGPSHAAAFTLNTDGSFSYTPTLNWSGSDSFTYKANDGALDSNVATVTITVNAVNTTFYSRNGGGTGTPPPPGPRRATPGPLPLLLPARVMRLSLVTTMW